METIKLERIKKFVERIEKENERFTEEEIGSIDISFELIISAFFPRSFSSFKESLTQEYIRGFNEGIKEKR